MIENKIIRRVHITDDFVYVKCIMRTSSAFLSTY